MLINFSFAMLFLYLLIFYLWASKGPRKVFLRRLWWCFWERTTKCHLSLFDLCEIFKDRSKDLLAVTLKFVCMQAKLHICYSLTEYFCCYILLYKHHLAWYITLKNKVKIINKRTRPHRFCVLNQLRSTFVLLLPHRTYWRIII